MIFRQLTLYALLLSTAVFLPAKANALSCARPDISRSFDFWSNSPLTFLLVRGTLSSTTPIPKMPKPSGDINSPTPPKPHFFRFVGVTIGRSGNQAFSQDVLVVPTCASAWCGGYPHSGKEVIMALEKTPSGYRHKSGPCGGNMFVQNLDGNEKALRLCLSGDCPKPVGIQ